MNPVDRSIFAVGTYSKDIGELIFEIIDTFYNVPAFTVVTIFYSTKLNHNIFLSKESLLY